MKHLLLTTIAAVVLVGCGPSKAELALLDAALEGNIEAVKKALADGVNVNAKAVGGGTPLHGAAFGGHTELGGLLIAAGADVNAKSDRSETPLDLAIKTNIPKPPTSSANTAARRVKN